MNKKWWIVIAVIVAIILAVIFWPKGSSKQTPGPTATTPASTTTTTATPTPQGQMGSASAWNNPTKVTREEFVNLALANKWVDDAVVEISGLQYEGLALPNSLLLFTFGPETNGYFVLVGSWTEYAPGLASLTEGDEVTIEGSYRGIQEHLFYTLKPGEYAATEANKIWHNGLVLGDGQVISVKK